MSPQEARTPSAGNRGVNDSARNDNPKPSKQEQKKAQKQAKADQKRESREERR